MTKNLSSTKALKEVLKKPLKIYEGRIGDLLPPIDDIRTSRDKNKKIPLNIRESIKEVGILNPLTINYDTKSNKKYTIDGETRRQICLEEKGGDEKVRFLEYQDLTRHQQIALNLFLNSNYRENLSEKETKEAVKLLINLGKSSDEIAKMLGHDIKHIEPFIEQVKYEEETGDEVESNFDFRKGMKGLSTNWKTPISAEIKRFDKKIEEHNIQINKIKDEDEREEKKEMDSRDKYRHLNNVREKVIKYGDELKNSGLVDDEEEAISLFAKTNGLPIIPNGSETKYSAFSKEILEKGFNGFPFEEIYFFNPDYPLMLNMKNKKKQKGMAQLCLEYADEVDAKILLIDRDSTRLEYWKKHEPRSMESLVNCSAENWLTVNMPKIKTNKKTLMVFHFGGKRSMSFQDRDFYDSRIFGDLKKLRSNLIIAFILIDEWELPEPTSSDALFRENNRTFGLIEETIKIKNAEDYLRIKEKQLCNEQHLKEGLKFSIIWKDKSRENGFPRRVLLIKAS